MIVLDAFAIEAFFADEPAAFHVDQFLNSGEQVIVNAINYAEFLDRVVRVRGYDRGEIEVDLDELGLTIGALDVELATDAGDLRSKHYHRATRAVSIADCCAAAHALARDARLATADPDLIDLMIDEGGDVVILHQSDGSLYNPNMRG